ncbi:MAG: serine hydroxymethyltransferase [Candidatus Diapherotrites archaeon]|uniref:Serine hydroxymethyltransferase n=1 Tax=Candidatus Iainarchaeum sp. TaxID=3101447 RepID=A0A8T4L107_9ARCH|nr:serine hydroxymethyltransferase [Candidatus Diapherotrites archaeon]
MHLDAIKQYDPDLFNAIEHEKKRQMDGIELIPSENLVSQAVLEAMGSILNNKYSEGYPGKRYYGGNEFTDVVENLAIDRAKKLFGAQHANVQPLSGSPANMAAYYATMEHGDTFLGMKLTEGGHLSHGHPVNFSGKWFHNVQYGLDRETEMLDYDAIRKLAIQEKPKLILSGYTAYPRSIDFKEFRKICDEVGAVCMADIAHIAGLCVTGVHENPVPFFDIVTTTTHKTLRGPRSGMILCKEEWKEKIDKAVFPGLQGGPHEHIIAGKAVCFKEAMEPAFAEYAKQIVKNAKALADELLAGGCTLASGGTDNHLLLVNTIKSKNLAGKQAETTLDKAGIYCNKNTIPFDERKPWDPSGIRIGTPVLTTRGMQESEMKEVGRFILEALDKPNDDAALSRIRSDVKEFCAGYPFYV